MQKMLGDRWTDTIDGEPQPPAFKYCMDVQLPGADDSDPRKKVKNADDQWDYTSPERCVIELSNLIVHYEEGGDEGKAAYLEYRGIVPDRERSTLLR